MQELKKQRCFYFPIVRVFWRYFEVKGRSCTAPYVQVLLILRITRTRAQLLSFNVKINNFAWFVTYLGSFCKKYDLFIFGCGTLGSLCLHDKIRHAEKVGFQAEHLFCMCFFIYDSMSRQVLSLMEKKTSYTKILLFNSRKLAL